MGPAGPGDPSSGQSGTHTSGRSLHLNQSTIGFDCLLGVKGVKMGESVGKVERQVCFGVFPISMLVIWRWV